LVKFLYFSEDDGGWYWTFLVGTFFYNLVEMGLEDLGIIFELGTPVM